MQFLEGEPSDFYGLLEDIERIESAELPPADHEVAWARLHGTVADLVSARKNR